MMSQICIMAFLLASIRFSGESVGCTTWRSIGGKDMSEIVMWVEHLFGQATQFHNLV